MSEAILHHSDKRSKVAKQLIKSVQLTNEVRAENKFIWILPYKEEENNS